MEAREAPRGKKRFRAAASGATVMPGSSDLSFNGPECTTLPPTASTALSAATLSSYSGPNILRSSQAVAPPTLEADSPVPASMVALTKKLLGDVLIIVGGGIRSGRAAAELVAAGADLIVTGTAVEKSQDVASFISELTSSIRR